MSSHTSLFLLSGIVWLSIGVFFLALVLIFLSALLEKRVGENLSSPFFKKLGGHILRDIAIAFFVALMVTGLYEGYVKAKLQLAERAKDFTEVLQSHVPDGVWSALNTHVINNPRIRRNVRIIFRLHEGDKFQPCQNSSDIPCRALLWMSYSYGLYGLGHNSTGYTIRHDVDEHFSGQGYPRFESATVIEPLSDGNLNQQNYDGPRLDRENKRTSFQQDVLLQPSYDYELKKYDDSKAVQVTTVRHEVVELPGIYPLGVPELMDGIEVYFIILGNLTYEPSIHTQWAGLKFTHVGNRKFTYEGKEEEGDLWTCQGILLPGQTFLMYFKETNKESSPANPVNPS